MTPLATTTDVSFGWVIVGLSLIAGGWLYLNLGPKLAEFIADLRAPRNPDRIIATGAKQPDHLARLLADHELEVMARVVDLVDSNPTNVVPMQRRGGQ